MMDKSISKEVKEFINISDLQLYLENHGWVRIEKESALIGIFRRADDPNAEILIPLKSTFSDYYLRLTDAISTLAEFEGRPAIDIIKDISASSVDVIRFRYDNDLVSEGMIPLIDGVEFFDNAKKAFTAAALSTQTAQKFHPRMYSSEVDQLLGSCKLGTERGSFIVSIIVPIPYSSQTTLLEGRDGGIARKTTSNLMRSLAFLSKSITEGNFDKIYSPTEEDPVVSANLCKAIINFFPSNANTNVTITSSYANHIRYSERLPTSVTFTSEYVSPLTAIEKNLRPKRPSEKDIFVGKVDSLHGEENEDGEMFGEVELLIQQSGEDSLVRARVDLNTNDYAKACDAHKLNKFISLEGDKEWKPRYCKIINYRNFKAVV